jgi:HK97 family phage major capsid protein
MTDTDPVLGQLRSQWNALDSEAKAIFDNPASTSEALVKADKLFDQRDQLDQQITERKKILDQVVSLKSRYSDGRTPQRGLPFSGRQPESNQVRFARIENGESEVDKLEPTGGFKSLGHFAWCQYKQGPDGRSGEPAAILANKDWIDLQRKTPSGMYEEADPDGGILVPRQFSNQIYERMVAMNLILQHLNPIPITGNTITIPGLLENSRADGSRGGGVIGYWTGEANQYTAVKSRLRDISLKLHKLTVLTFITEELMNDSAGAIQAFLMGRAPREINFKINDAVLNGTGDGMPLGIMNSNSKITATAVSGQGSATFVWKNVVQMYKRVIAGQRNSLIWLYNQDAEDQLFLLYMPTGTAAGVAIFKPNEAGNGFTLQGRPALVMEQCQTIGTEGDVIAFATDGYACATKGGVESFMSMHLRFDYDEVAYKWRFRFDGQPYDDVPLTPFKGNNTVSSIVTLNSSRT